METALKYQARGRLKAGFTIFEILIVIGIIGLLMVFLLPNIGRIFTGAPRAGTDLKLKEVQSAIAQFQLNTLKQPNRLMDLVIKPSDQKIAAKWRGPYLDDEPVDGWGNQFKYELTPGKSRPYNLYSYGPNGPGSDQEDWINVWDL